VDVYAEIVFYRGVDRPRRRYRLPRRPKVVGEDSLLYQVWRYN
jgi:hypothetical protein